MAAHLEGAVFENAISRRGRRFVVISQVRRRSPVARYGIDEGDIVLSANRIPVETVDDLVNAVATRRGASLLEIQRGNFSQSVLVE